MQKQFYAYVYLRSDGTPYYIGKGYGQRAYHKAAHNVHIPKEHSRILIFERNSEQEAFETEKELIFNWGRKDNNTGILRNLTDGGDGQSGRIFSVKSRERLLERNRGNKFASGHKRPEMSAEKLSEWGRRGALVRWGKS